MKIIAYYLPQFHEIKENNEWWGEGFTEWTNIKNAKALYRNHYQPIEPKNDNYYNLLDKKTVEWQTKLSIENNIYGFCYYHYWFNGKLILEKPAENLLNWKDIPQKYCFCWANHSWKKTWNGSNEILINQTYGNIQEWEDHFNYLLPFFKDDRYIKINNKPVFLIYSSIDVVNLDKRIDFYNKRCIEEGFEGLYFVESLNSKNTEISSEKSNAVVLREPAISLSCLSNYQKIIRIAKSRLKRNYLGVVKKYQYKTIIDVSIKYTKNFSVKNKKVFLGAFSGWDSTPRHGRRGYVIEGNTEELFEQYLMRLNEMANEKDSDYLFLNAWNEWAEGMYLEPDKNRGELLLNVISKVMDSRE